MTGSYTKTSSLIGSYTETSSLGVPDYVLRNIVGSLGFFSHYVEVRYDHL